MQTGTLLAHRNKYVVFFSLLFSLFVEWVYLPDLALFCNYTPCSEHVHAIDYKMTKKSAL